MNTIKGSKLQPSIVSFVIANELLTAVVKHLKTIDIPGDVFGAMEDTMGTAGEVTWEAVRVPGRNGCILRAVPALDMDRAPAGAPPAINDQTGEINL